MIITKKVDFKIHEGFCDNYFPKEKPTIGQYRIDIFYSMKNEIVTLVLEIMVDDTIANQSKILNYVTFLEIFNNVIFVKNNLEQFVRNVKFDNYLLANFIENIQKELKIDFSKFEYLDLNGDICYYNLMNNHFHINGRVTLPLDSKCQKSSLNLVV